MLPQKRLITVHQVDMRARQRPIPFAILLVLQLGGNIIQKQPDMANTQLIHLHGLGQQAAHIFLIAITEGQARRDAIPEIHAARRRAFRHAAKLPQVIRAIKLLPAFPVVRVIFGRVKITVHPLRLHQREQIAALVSCPRFAVVALDYAAYRK